MAKINREMIDNLNRALKSFGVGFYYEFQSDSVAPKAVIEVRDTVDEDVPNWVHSSIVNVTDEYIDWLRNFFKNSYDIELCINNTNSIIWSNDFS